MALSKSEIQKFKGRLEEMRAQLTQALKGAREEVKGASESGGYSQHQADQGTDNFNETVNLELTSQEVSILKQIDRALEKIEEGTYGICDISDRPIPKPRLEAIPYATMTVQAQEELEQEKKRQQYNY